MATGFWISIFRTVQSGAVPVSRRVGRNPLAPQRPLLCATSEFAGRSIDLVDARPSHVAEIWTTVPAPAPPSRAAGRSRGGFPEPRVRDGGKRSLESRKPCMPVLARKLRDSSHEMKPQMVKSRMPRTTVQLAIIAATVGCCGLAQAHEVWPIIPPELGVRSAGVPVLAPYVCVPYAHNFYHGTNYSGPPAVHLGYAYRFYYRYSAYRRVPVEYVCSP
jgi:hypothetical protein